MKDYSETLRNEIIISMANYGGIAITNNEDTCNNDFIELSITIENPNKKSEAKRIFVDYKIPTEIYHDILYEVDILKEEIETFGNYMEKENKKKEKVMKSSERRKQGINNKKENVKR
jgi:hypothetical protein